jgi:hypothetical protein
MIAHRPRYSPPFKKRLSDGGRHGADCAVAPLLTQPVGNGPGDCVYGEEELGGDLRKPGARVGEGLCRFAVSLISGNQRGSCLMSAIPAPSADGQFASFQPKPPL